MSTARALERARADAPVLRRRGHLARARDTRDWESAARNTLLCRRNPGTYCDGVDAVLHVVAVVSSFPALAVPPLRSDQSPCLVASVVRNQRLMTTPSYSSICVVRSIGYEIFTSVIFPSAPITGSSFGWTKPLYDG